ncbi:GNAT family N-acetyltransferase [Pseudomonas sp. 5P_3.1_Bac2]|uniref:GNAT family N-acetyltransferase n=1 Tax=Pseudomonas sp. 5P_3.1_Bac2 TaxID=2971617 RepID=UPI0021C58B48|nr:GNAT family N-acetyltransferase [Pseudomonas sp. 5P_3.1_Bac2]MCU1715773.1 GNAT family N-acetyltransferase [Pseudomonas sp. 5P_3.1_Bac2]
MHYRLLPSELKPLVDKFYRQQRAHMRASAGAQYWVAQEGEIVAALNLNPLPEGYWLTALLVAHARRQQGLATGLVQAALAQQQQPAWLFCQPQLCDFYQRLGFTPANALPPALGQRLARYRQSKDLLAMHRLTQPSS